MTRGVFWIVEDKLIAYPFDKAATEGIAKSGNTYNHKLLWEHIKPCNKPFDYYPRGRVDYNARGVAIIYMNPHIEDKYIKEFMGHADISTTAQTYTHMVDDVFDVNRRRLEHMTSERIDNIRKKRSTGKIIKLNK